MNADHAHANDRQHAAISPSEEDDEFMETRVDSSGDLDHADSEYEEEVWSTGRHVRSWPTDTYSCPVDHLCRSRSRPRV